MIPRMHPADFFWYVLVLGMIVTAVVDVARIRRNGKRNDISKNRFDDQEGKSRQVQDEGRQKNSGGAG